MDGLFIAGALGDLGPSALDPTSTPTKLYRAYGPRPSRLRAELRTFCPRTPGVYGMVDRHGELIYVGKAKILRARLLSYFRTKSRDPKAGRILRHTETILWEVSPSEFAALHRELELIRRWRPRLNIQGQPLRRQFTHVCLGPPPAPYLFLSRRPPKSVRAWFGPIPLSYQAREAVRRLNDLFRLRDCPQAQDMVFAEQADLFPDQRVFGCLRYELGNCLGPCAAACSRKDYMKSVRGVHAFLSGEDRATLDELQAAMEVAAAEQQFERAAVLRDKLQPLRWLAAKLEQIRRARTEGCFIYPVMGTRGETLWYLMHGGRTVTALRAPTDADSARLAIARIEEVYRNDPSATLDAYEHADSLMLVAAWFRKYAKERMKTLTPAEALKRCRAI